MRDAGEFLDRLRADNRNALDEIGSSDALYALTEGNIDMDTLLATVADAHFATSQTFADWAADEEFEDVREEFARLADEEQDHSEAIADRLGNYEPTDNPDALNEYLRLLDDPLQRVGASLAGHTLVSQQATDRLIEFFLDEGDQASVELFRSVNADLDDRLARAHQQLESLCDDGDDWDTAFAAATDAIDHAHREHQEVMDSLDVNPEFS